MENIAQKMDVFLEKQGINSEAYRRFASLAAVPLLLSPDLLYKLWRNFKTFKNSDGKSISIPYFVVSDVLLSNFCRPVGFQLFKLEENVRKALLNELDLKQKQEVATFIQQYAQKHFNASERNIQQIHLKLAKSYLNPSELVAEIKDSLLDKQKSSYEKNQELQLYFQLEGSEKEDGALGLVLREAAADTKDFMEIERRFLRGKLEERIGEKDEKIPPKFLLPIPEIEKLTKISEDGLDLNSIKELFIKHQHINVEIDDLTALEFLVSFIRKFENEFKHIIYLNSENDFLSLLSHYKIKSEPIINYETLDSLHIELKKLMSPKIVLINNTNTYYSKFDLKYIFEDFLILTASNRHLIEADQSVSYSHVLEDKVLIIKDIVSPNRNIEKNKNIEEIRIENSNLMELKIEKNHNLKTIIIENSDIESIDFGEIPNTFIIKNCKVGSIYTRNTLNLKTFIFVNSFKEHLKATIADYINLEELILDGKFNERILELPLSKLKRLTLNNNSYLVDIKPIRKFINLEYLDLRANKIISFERELLYDLPNLKELYLQGNNLGGLFEENDNCLPVLKEWIEIGKNQKPQNILNLETLLKITLTETKDIDDFKDYDKSKLYIQNGFGVVTHLNLNECKLKNIDFLEEFTDLEALSLYHNHIHDISVLAKLTKLKYLCLSINYIEDISALKELTDLEDLRITNNKIIDFTPIAALTNLKILRIRQNKIDDNGFLSTLQNLEDIWIDNNNLTNLGAITHLSKLKSLHIERNKIAILSEQEVLFLAQLEYVNLYNNVFTAEATGIKDKNYLPFIKQLIAGTTELSGIEKLQRRLQYTLKETQDESKIIAPNLRESGYYILNESGQITHLNLLGFELKDLSFLEDFKDLEVLNLNGNSISKIEEIAGLTKLRKLDLGNNRVEKTVNIKKCKELEYLDLSNNEIENFVLDDIWFFPKLTNLKLFGNPIASIPVEIYQKANCIDDLRSYYKELNKDNKNYQKLFDLIAEGLPIAIDYASLVYDDIVESESFQYLKEEYQNRAENFNLREYTKKFTSFFKKQSKTKEGLKVKAEVLRTYEFSTPEEALTFFAENPNTDRKVEIISFLSENFDFFAKKMESVVIQKIYNKNALAIDSVNISIDKIKDITKYAFDNILIIQGSIIVDVEYSPTESNIDNIEDYPSTFNFDFAITLEQDNNTWKVIQQPGYIEQITILDKLNDDDYEEDIIDFKTPTEALTYFAENPDTDRKDEIIKAILDDNSFLRKLLEQTTYDALGGEVITSEHYIDDLIIEEISDLSFDNTSEEVLLIGNGELFVIMTFDKDVEISRQFSLQFKLRIAQSDKWEVVEGIDSFVKLYDKELLPTFKTAQSSKYLGNKNWKWSVWIEGIEKDLDMIDYIIYFVFPQATPEVIFINTRENKFLFETEGWRALPITFEIHLKDEQVIKLKHDLILQYPEFDKNKALDLLSKNKIDAVFVMMNDYLSQIDDKQVQMTLNLLQAEFNLLKRNEIINSFSNQELNLKINQFKNRLIKLINLITIDKNTVFQKSLENQTILKTKIVSFNSGGFMVEYLGKKAFLPKSQVIDKEILSSDSIGKEIEIIVLKYDEEKKNYIVSNQLAVEQIKLEQKKDEFDSLKIGQEIEGEVISFVVYGAFVKLTEHITGLLHNSEISWKAVNQPQDVLSLNQKIKTQIIDIDKENFKVSLSLKALEEKPNLAVLYKIGDIVEGTVIKSTEERLEIKLSDNILAAVIGKENILKKKEIPRNQKNKYKNGDIIKAKIIGFDTDKVIVNLSIFQYFSDLFHEYIANLSVGDEIEGVVERIVNSGLVIELTPDLTAYLSASDFTWYRKYTNPEDFAKVGDKIKVKILEFDNKLEIIRIGHKQLETSPWTSNLKKKYKIGTIFDGEVLRKDSRGYYISTPDKVEAFMPLNLKEDVAIGEQYLFEVMEFDAVKNMIKVELSRDASSFAIEESTE